MSCQNPESTQNFLWRLNWNSDVLSPLLHNKVAHLFERYKYFTRAMMVPRGPVRNRAPDFPSNSMAPFRISVFFFSLQFLMISSSHWKTSREHDRYAFRGLGAVDWNLPKIIIIIIIINSSSSSRATKTRRRRRTRRCRTKDTIRTGRF